MSWPPTKFLNFPRLVLGSNVLKNETSVSNLEGVVVGPKPRKVEKVKIVKARMGRSDEENKAIEEIRSIMFTSQGAEETPYDQLRFGEDLDRHSCDPIVDAESPAFSGVFRISPDFLQD
eukprot:CAMPEP_0197542958 /NCGR_PEP_ID=MMETSP1318-20131121/67961_1 /TAXON_ID=552666 /ORGANISM="Partenskyella glossopodia, Strain RCC365" /LENGTH=118 /DNA_ID=CAMNT_0043102259 /DNA_START=165 /DNA_END=521 /DNA_ORIENTATION=+